MKDLARKEEGGLCKFPVAPERFVDPEEFNEFCGLLKGSKIPGIDGCT
jgi:hypothetical protein